MVAVGFEKMQPSLYQSDAVRALQVLTACEKRGVSIYKSCADATKKGEQISFPRNTLSCGDDASQQEQSENK